MSNKLRTVICFFRNDLRIHDNECLSWAHQHFDFVLPLYCLDPEHFKGTYHFGFPKTGFHRSKFLLESLTDLRHSLQKHGSNLIVRHEKPSVAIQELINQCSQSIAPVSSVVFQKEVCSEEIQVESSIVKICQAAKIQVKTFWGSTLFHRDDLPYAKKDIPDTYTQFRKTVEARCKVRGLTAECPTWKPLPQVENGKLGDIPSLADLKVEPVEVGRSYPDPRSAFPFAGGETSGLDRIHRYYWVSDNVAKYKETRNGLLGSEYSTKFSAWLANGSVSPRYIYHKLKEYEAERVSNQSTYWVIFELIWRDYFRFVSWKYADLIFYPGGIMGKAYPWQTNKTLFQMWCQGRTGVPFVDANMRELLYTGWMSNRGRQNVASFLVKDLNLDWRLGAEWFESLLLDHDVCSNYGNWNYSAGIGNDPRENRKFNMIKQGLDYDPEGKFVQTWVPELQRVPQGKIHVPWTLSEKESGSIGLELGVDYPTPVITAPEWSRHFHKTSAKPKDPRNAAGRGRGSKPKSGQQKGIDFYFKSGHTKS
ncbi:cryptochrome DASH-like [Tigriopus californicus]|nr:cryptochrome DASH-like [Tigriopus californicus]